MKIFFSSHLFPPSIGGLENVGLMLAQEFRAAGHEVRVVTQTPGSGDNFGFKVIRKPKAGDLLKLTRWSDIIFHNNISLRALWPLLAIDRPWVVTHHIWMEEKGRLGPIKAGLKKLIIRAASANIAISKAIASELPVSSITIPDPYQEDVFKLLPEIARNQDLIFVGRLVSTKGANLLIEALARLKAVAISPKLTVVGCGPEEGALHQQVRQSGLGDQVAFAGVKTGAALAQLLNQHKILVVPSRWQEPFGIVALEGIACGCVVAGTEGGGLKDAIGPCGVTFKNGDVAAMAKALGDLLAEPSRWAGYRAAAPEHLVQFLPKAVSRAYLRVFENQLSTARVPCLETKTSI